MTPTPANARQPVRTELETVTIRFAGDSGDGMQLTGTQFTETSAILGNDINTFPDFPAEIRAPAGTLPGVSGFQLSFSSRDIHTPGDVVHALVAMNPAALKVNLADLELGGILIVNTDSFTENDLKKAAYDHNPLEGPGLEGYRLFKIDVSTQTMRAVEAAGLNKRAAEKCKNFYALGVVYYLYDRPLDHTRDWIASKFGGHPDVAQANTLALEAGWSYAETMELFNDHYKVRAAKLPPGTYRQITGNSALALAAAAVAVKTGREVVLCGYPITPASDILHEMARMQAYGVKTFQAEDEIAAAGAAIGASFGGALAMTTTSGPGLALKGEALGLAVMTELPLVVVDVQRAGPSTGMPTKTEQADLNMALFGRHGECPMPVFAPATPGECFTILFEAFRVAVKFMTPVLVLSDGYLANGAEPWLVPDPDKLPEIVVAHRTDPEGFTPYVRDPDTLARAWAVPGTPGLEHRIGGLEKDFRTGNVSYDPANHERMVHTRRDKVLGVARHMPPQEVVGDETGDVLVVGWGGTYGALLSAVESLRAEGRSVSLAQVRSLHPLPSNLGDLLRGFKRVVVPELNLGQLAARLRSEYLVDAIPFTKVKGKPFLVQEVRARVLELFATL